MKIHIMFVAVFGLCINHTAFCTVNKIRSTHLQKQPLLRKFNTAAFFQGLADSCTQTGNIVAAQTDQEKQQAACNLLASIFQTASVLSEKTQKRTLLCNTIVTNLATAIITFFQTLSPEEHAKLLKTGYKYLRQLMSFTLMQHKKQYIIEILTDPIKGRAFFSELLLLSKKIVLALVPEKKHSCS